MGYNNNGFEFNYDMEVVIKNAKTGAVVCTFKARENTQVVNDAGFEAGGVASGGQNYSIATNADIHQLITPYAQQAVVDGVEYKVLSKGFARAKVSTSFLTRKKVETIIYLG